MSTLQEMLLLARIKLKDLNLKRWTELELVAAANEGKNELTKIIRQAREDYFVTTATGSVSATTAPNPTTITLPSDFAELKKIEITTSGYEDVHFEPMDLADDRFHSALVDGPSSSPQSFYYDIYGSDTLVLAPGAGISLAYKIHYVQTVPDMELLTATPTRLPREHWDWIVTWIVCEALRSGEDNRLVNYERKLGYQTENILNSVNARQIAKPEFVRGFMEGEVW